MTIGFIIKAWDKLNYGDVILASNGSDEVIGKVDSPPTDSEVFVLDRNHNPVLLVKSDGWEIKLRSL